MTECYKHYKQRVDLLTNLVGMPRKRNREGDLQRVMLPKKGVYTDCFTKNTQLCDIDGTGLHSSLHVSNKYFSLSLNKAGPIFKNITV